MREAVEQAIQIPYPVGERPRLRIVVGPVRLTIAAGEGEDLAVGTYRDPTGTIPLQIERVGSEVRIAQRYEARLPRLRGVPTLDLRLGTARPYAVAIDGGANEIVADFGGLPLVGLESRHAAGQLRVMFSAPNLVAMERLTLTAGAAEVRLSKLANANAAEIAIDGGAAAFNLDFGGTLRRDTRAKITAGAAGVEVRVPAATAARIAARTMLGGLDAGNGFVTRDGGYWTEAAVAGRTPLLTIDVHVAVSGLKLRLGEAELPAQTGEG